MYNSRDLLSIATNFIRDNSLCWYRLERYSLQINGIDFQNISFHNAEVEIFRKSSYRIEKVDDVKLSFNKRVSYGGYSSIYIVARNQDDKFGNITVSAKGFERKGYDTKTIVIIVIS